MRHSIVWVLLLTMSLALGQGQRVVEEGQQGGHLQRSIVASLQFGGADRLSACRLNLTVRLLIQEFELPHLAT